MQGRLVETTLSDLHVADHRGRGADEPGRDGPDVALPACHDLHLLRGRQRRRRRGPPSLRALQGPPAPAPDRHRPGRDPGRIPVRVWCGQGNANDQTVLPRCATAYVGDDWGGWSPS